MTQRPDEQDVDIEQALVRYMVERRITRRMLLEQSGKVGAFAALAPIIAACTSAAASAAPSQAPLPRPRAHDRPDSRGDRGTHRHPEPTPVPDAREAAEHLQLGRVHRRDDAAGLREEVRDQGQLRQVPDASTQITKIRSDGKGGGYDLTYPASTDVAPLARDGVIAALDLSLIPNIKNLGPAWKDPPTTRATGIRSPTTGGRPGSPGTRTRSRRTSRADCPVGRGVQGQDGMLSDQQEVFAAGAFRLG
jgi:hypothetical protein